VELAVPEGLHDVNRAQAIWVITVPGVSLQLVTTFGPGLYVVSYRLPISPHA